MLANICSFSLALMNNGARGSCVCLKRFLSNISVSRSMSKGNGKKFTFNHSQVPSFCCRLMSKETMKSSSKNKVAVEGNIGSGKTTVLEKLNRFSDVQIIKEPVQKWKNLKGHNLLNLMYQDPNKWSFSFQSYVQLTMAEAHSKVYEFFDRVKLMERSIYSARYCFVENLYRSKKMSSPDYAILSEWFNFITSDQKIHLDLIVYLRASPHTCYHNIKKRGREEEQNISLDYLTNLHSLHDEWLIKKNFDVPCQVLVLNADCNKACLEKLCDQHARKILFMNQSALTLDAAIVDQEKKHMEH